MTHGAGRIGRAITLALHRAGYAVAIHATDAAGEAETLRDEIVRAGGCACVTGAALAEADLVKAAALLGALRLLVDLAGDAPLALAQVFAAQAADDGASIVSILDTGDALGQATIPMLARALAPKLRVNAVSVASDETDPADIAAAVVYLARARSVTGVTLRIGESVPE